MNGATTKTNRPLVVYAEAAMILQGWVKFVNDRFVAVTLETDEKAVLPLGQLNRSVSDLRPEDGDFEGTEISVRVLAVDGDGFRGRRILVSEKAVNEDYFAKYLGRETAESDAIPVNKLPDALLAKYRQKLADGHHVRGVVKGSAPGGGFRIDLGDCTVILSRTDLAGVKAESLRQGIAVKVWVKEVSDKGIVVTKQAPAEKAA